MNDLSILLQENDTSVSKEMFLSIKKSIKSFLKKNLTLGTFLNYVKSLFKKKSKFSVMDMLNNLKLAIYLGSIGRTGVAFSDALKNSYEKNVYLTARFFKKFEGQQPQFAVFLTASDMVLNTTLIMILMTTTLGKLIKENIFSFAMATYTWGYLTFIEKRKPDFSDLLEFFRGKNNEQMNGLSALQNEQMQREALAVTLSPIFEESSKKVANDLGLTAEYFAIFNAAELYNYVTQMKKAGIKTTDAVLLRLIAVGGHGVFTMLHRYGFPKSALMAHMLWNFLASMGPVMEGYLAYNKTAVLQRFG